MVVTKEALWGGRRGRTAPSLGSRWPARGRDPGAVEHPAQDGGGPRCSAGKRSMRCRESQIPAHELESWKRMFLDSGAGAEDSTEPRSVSRWPGRRSGVYDAARTGRAPHRKRDSRTSGRDAAMKTTISPSTSRRYPLRMICQVWHVARSSVYAATTASLGPPNGDPAHAGTIITTHPDEMGDRRHTVLYRGRRLVLALRGHRPSHRPVARRHVVARRSLPRSSRFGKARHAFHGFSKIAGGSRSAATGGRSISPTPGSTR
jgi:hypothetical protein